MTARELVEKIELRLGGKIWMPEDESWLESLLSKALKEERANAFEEAAKISEFYPQSGNHINIGPLIAKRIRQLAEEEKNE